MSDTLNHNKLWQRVKEGDSSAFDLLYDLYVQPIFAAVHRHIDSRADAEDIVQEVFLDFWEQKEQITIERSVFNYLYSIARYKTLRYIVKKKARPESLPESHLEPSIFQDSYTPSRLNGIRLLVDKEIEELPEQMKKVYSLHSEEGKSIAEIADELAISPYTVKNHLARVRKRLRSFTLRLSSFLMTVVVLTNYYLHFFE